LANLHITQNESRVIHLKVGRYCMIMVIDLHTFAHENVGADCDPTHAVNGNSLVKKNA